MSADDITYDHHDPRTIGFSDEHEVRYWTKELDVNEQQLHAVVDTVGNSAERVRDYIRRLQHY